MSKIFRIFGPIVLNFLALETILIKPHLLWWMIGFMFTVSCIITFRSVRYDFKGLSPLNFLILPNLLLIGAILNLLLIANPVLRQILIIFYSLCFYISQDILTRRVIPKVLSDKSETVSLHFRDSFIVTATYFLICTGIWGFYFYLDLSSIQTCLLLLLATVALFYQTLWQANLIFVQTWIYVLMLGLIVTEVFWVISFWPIAFWVNASVLVIIFYVYRGLVWMYLQKAFGPRLLKEYLFVGFALLVILLLSAKWTL